MQIKYNYISFSTVENVHTFCLLQLNIINTDPVQLNVQDETFQHFEIISL